MAKHLLWILTSVLVVGCGYPMSLVGIEPDLGSVGGSFDDSIIDPNLQANALEILEVNCAGCHGHNSGIAGIYGLNDLNHMIREGYIVPGNINASSLYQSIRADTGTMPLGQPMSQDKIDVIRDWIIAMGST